MTCIQRGLTQSSVLRYAQIASGLLRMRVGSGIGGRRVTGMKSNLTLSSAKRVSKGEREMIA